ncbi:MAG TPA: histidine kinase dimerization/phospho-acceptor domain-containing protein, partial [Lachnospiraceae bacterium]|nr:histidine kinase dimerization/phospho-acceptor domain-containing protein [Lachnospiraceae bacterium]
MKKNTFNAPGIESNTIETLSAKLLEVTDLLSKSNEKLKREQKEREEMLANISHDLRAPITAIRSAIDYLTSDQKLSKEDINSSLLLIDRRTKTLENLIQDMYYL